MQIKYESFEIPKEVTDHKPVEYCLSLVINGTAEEIRIARQELFNCLGLKFIQKDK